MFGTKQYRYTNRNDGSALKSIIHNCMTYEIEKIVLNEPNNRIVFYFSEASNIAPLKKIAARMEIQVEWKREKLMRKKYMSFFNGHGSCSVHKYLI